MPTQALPQRFGDKVDKNGPNGCWSWLAAIDQAGYGRFRYEGKVKLAHRLAYQDLVGEIPQDLQCDHLCRNRACANPAHIELVTQRVNMLRGVSPSAINARKTRCLRGHALSGENLRITLSGDRRCRECDREAKRRWISANRDSINANQRARRAQKEDS